MSFKLEHIIPWGRNFDEYRAMFALPDDLQSLKILGCGDGPASFNTTATRQGGWVVSVDPLYRYSAARIADRIQTVTPTIQMQLRDNADAYLWTYFSSPDTLIKARLSAMQIFLEDYRSADSGRRYISGALPQLPFANDSFDMALCSHVLFLYSEMLSESFHLDAVRELCRVAEDVRIFPLHTLTNQLSPHLEPVITMLQKTGHTVRITRVNYEFQRGANQMVHIRRR